MNGKRLLLVEDNDDDLELAVLALERAGLDTMSVEVARSGEEALDRLANRAREGFPVIVVLDINMPGIDGFEVLERIQASDWGSVLAVVMLSSSDMAREIERAMALGAIGYLTKPLRASKLDELLRESGVTPLLADRRESR